MSEGQDAILPHDNRIAAEIDYSSEPEQWIRAKTKEARTFGYIKNFTDEVEGLEICGNGAYEQKFIWETTGEILSTAQTISHYAKALLEKGVEKVNIVDFGAGAAETLCEAAVDLEDLIKQEKVKIIATNLVTVPTEEDIYALQRTARTEEEIKRWQAFHTAVTKQLVDFRSADILELEELLKGNPIHLMFMVNVLPATAKCNDFLLQKIGEMLDPEKGTLVLGHRTLGGSHVDQSWQLVREGVTALTDAGFTQEPNKLIEESKDLQYTTFQASQAPIIKPS